MCNLLAPNYRNEHRQIVGRSELERRGEYMAMIYSQLREKHPLLQMIEGCLDFPEDRPSICEVLEQARAEIRDEQTDMNKLELLRALHSQPRNQVRVTLLLVLCSYCDSCHLCPEYGARPPVTCAGGY